MSFFSPPKPQAPRAAPVTPRLSDTELLAREQSDKLRKRKGVEDSILSLGRQGTTSSERPSRMASLLGRVGL